MRDGKERDVVARNIRVLLRSGSKGTTNVIATVAEGSEAAPHCQDYCDRLDQCGRSHPLVALTQDSVLLMRRCNHQRSHGSNDEMPAASEVAAILLPHFAEEEAYPMPPLGLVEPLARNEPLDDAQVQQVIQMVERLRHDYGKMLREHELMTEALRKLVSAGKEEGKPDHVAFPAIQAKAEGYNLYAVIDASGDMSQMASQATLDRMTQAGIIPITTNVVVTEVQRIWIRPDAAPHSTLYGEFAPHYRVVTESYQKAQEAAGQPKK